MTTTQSTIHHLIEREEACIKLSVAHVLSNADDLRQVSLRRVPARSYVSSIRSCLDDIEHSLSRLEALRDVEEKP